MATDKRRRELARAKAERQAQRRSQRAQRARRNKVIGFAAAATVIGAVIVWGVVGSNSDSVPAAEEAVPSQSESATASPAANTPGPVATPAGVTCEQPGEARTDIPTFDKPTDQGLTGTVNWVLNTNCGRITMALSLIHISEPTRPY